MAQAIRSGDHLGGNSHEITRVDLWFLREIQKIVTSLNKTSNSKGIPQDKVALLQYKRMGFSDARLAELAQKNRERISAIFGSELECKTCIQGSRHLCGRVFLFHFLPLLLL